MSDLLDDLYDNLGNPLDPEVTGISEVRSEPGRNGVAPLSDCATCGKPLPAEGEEGYHPTRKYHNECRKYKAKGPKVSPNPGDPSPKSVTTNIRVNLGSKAKTDNSLKAVEEGAATLLAFLPMGFALMGDEVCAEALTQAVPAIAHQLALLSKYHPAIRKIFTSTEGSGEAMAWVGLMVTLSPVLITVLVHHNVLKGQAAERLGAVAAAMGLLANASDSED